MSGLFIRIKRLGIIPLLGFLMAILTYWGAWHGYFQQDEWSGFGRVIAAQQKGVGELVRFSGSHFTPLSIFNVATLYSFFGLNHAGYGVWSVLLHAINAFLVFALAKAMTRNSTIATLSSVMFAIAYTPQQSVTWYAASMANLPGTLFALIGLILFEKFLSIRSRKFLWTAIACVFVSAGFRETGILLLPYFVLRDRTTWRPVILVFLLYLGMRFVPLLFPSRLTTVAPHVSRFGLWDILYQAITFTIFYLPRLLVPIEIPVTFARMIFGESFRLAYDSILNIFYAGVSISTILWLVKIRKTPAIVSSILLIFVGLLPLALLPRPYTLDSRHFYFPLVGFALLAGQIVHRYIHSKIVVLTFLIFLGINILLIRQEIGRIYAISRVRTSIINQWMMLYPHAPDHAVFLSQGDPLLFQSGFGQMLLVLYKVVPQLGDYFLFDINQQGYRNIGESGFGYFTDEMKFREAYCQYGLTPQQVFVASWNAQQEVLTDISKTYRMTLSCM